MFKIWAIIPLFRYEQTNVKEEPMNPPQIKKILYMMMKAFCVDNTNHKIYIGNIDFVFKIIYNLVFDNSIKKSPLADDYVNYVLDNNS